MDVVHEKISNEKTLFDEWDEQRSPRQQQHEKMGIEDMTAFPMHKGIYFKWVVFDEQWYNGNGDKKSSKS